ncbi:MAG: F0F1 ATP synthase subunit delta [Acidimicrobiales bacterium]
MIPALQGYLAAIEEALGTPGSLLGAGDEMLAVAELVEGNRDLLLAMNDGSVPVASRRAVLDRLLESRVRSEVKRLVHQSVNVVAASELTSSFRWSAARLHAAASASGDRTRTEPGEEVLGRLGSRNRVSGYAAAVFETVTVEEIEEIEDQLFRFARTVESDRRLRGALGDRDLPVGVRQQVVGELLGERALPSTRRLADFAVRGGRARDIVSTLDTLVDDAARARGWRVAKITSAEDVDAPQRQELRDALALLTGHPVDLQLTRDPRLLGGVVVRIGDLQVDSTTRHRFDELKEHLHASVEAYQVPVAPIRREASDG